MLCIGRWEGGLRTNILAEIGKIGRMQVGKEPEKESSRP